MKENRKCYVVDGGTNFQLAISRMDEEIYRCGCHLLSTILKQSLKGLDNFFEPFYELIIYFRNRIPNDYYEKSCKELGVQHYKLILDMEIRWNSTFKALSKLIIPLKNNSLQNAIKYCKEDKSIKNNKIPEYPNESQIEELEKIIQLLEKFNYVTEKFENIQNHNISHVYIGLFLLKQYCGVWKATKGLSANNIIIIELLEKELNIKINELFITHKIACYFNPKSKDKLTKDEKKTIRSLIKSWYEIEKSLQSSDDELEKEMNNLFDGKTNQRTKDKSIDQILDKYEKEVSNLSIFDDPLIWWKENQSFYNPIIHIVKDYLAIVPSASNIERVWSHGGLIITDVKNSYNSKTFTELLFVYCNLDFFDAAVKLLFENKFPNVSFPSKEVLNYNDLIIL